GSMSARRLRPSSRFDPPEFVMVMCGSPATTDGPAAATGSDVADGCAHRGGMPCGFPHAGSADAGDGTRCLAVGGDERGRLEKVSEEGIEPSRGVNPTGF